MNQKLGFSDEDFKAGMIKKKNTCFRNQLKILLKQTKE